MTKLTLHLGFTEIQIWFFKEWFFANLSMEWLVLGELCSLCFLFFDLQKKGIVENENVTEFLFKLWKPPTSSKVWQQKHYNSWVYKRESSTSSVNKDLSVCKWIPMCFKKSLVWLNFVRIPAHFCNFCIAGMNSSWRDVVVVSVITLTLLWLEVPILLVLLTILFAAAIPNRGNAQGKPVPGPFGWPFFGNVLDIMEDPLSMKNTNCSLTT